MTGAVNAFKRPGQSSRDLVDRVRGLTGIRKAGHAGTLDPGAAGVLPILLGRATRLQEFLSTANKVYVAEATFGAETDSGDAYGEVIRTADRVPGRPDVLGALDHFVGEGEQVPPMTSALKRHGVPLYRLARRGITVPREPRRVRIYALEMLEWRAGPPHRGLFRIECSPGTYIRTLIEDLGRCLDSAAFMSFLVRTRVGSFHLRDAVVPDDSGVIPIVSPADVLCFLPSKVLNLEQALSVAHGGIPADLGEIPQGLLRLLDGNGRLVAVGRGEGDALRLQCVLVRPEEIGGDG